MWAAGSRQPAGWRLGVSQGRKEWGWTEQWKKINKQSSVAQNAFFTVSRWINVFPSNLRRFWNNKQHMNQSFGRQQRIYVRELTAKSWSQTKIIKCTSHISRLECFESSRDDGEVQQRWCYWQQPDQTLPAGILEYVWWESAWIGRDTLQSFISSLSEKSSQTSEQT